MAITMEDKIKKAKQKRSQSIMQKINILWSRDGSDAPEIESQKDIDAFNREQYFGASTNANINWNHMGVEGLIRCYYHISYLIRGTLRNNVVRESNESLPSYTSAYRANLTYTAGWFLNGRAHYSGFFPGWKKDEQGGYRSSDASDDDISAARKGEFLYSDSSFKSNRDLIKKTRQEGDDTVTYYQRQDEKAGLLIDDMQDLIALIGQKSTLGEREFESFTAPTIAQLVRVGEILGERCTDVYPYDFENGGMQSNSGPDGGFTMLPDIHTYGNGVYDGYSSIDTPDYTADPHKWDASWTSAISSISSALKTLKTYIEYTKISDPEYFINTDVIPGFADDFSMQDGWIASIDSMTTQIDSFVSLVTSNYSNGRTSSSVKSAIDSGLESLVNTLNSGQSTLNSIHSTINPGDMYSADYGAGFFGDPEDGGVTMWGLRAQWIKSLIDSQDGSKIILESLDSVIATMNANVSKSEEQFGLFNIKKKSVSWNSKSAWVGGMVTPELVGIQEHNSIDTDINSANFGDFYVDGYIIAWEKTDHATGYDIYRSYDWDGSTGTFTKILPQGNSFSIQDTNPNDGRVYSYYIDLDVNLNADPPYYKIQSFDSGGSGDYSRIPSESDVGTPKNIYDFEATGASMPANSALGNPGSGSTTTDDGSEIIVGSYWKSPALTYAALPNVGNIDGDVRLVINEGTLYFYDADESAWFSLGSGKGWKGSVEHFALLPTIGNEDGDIRLVRDVASLYRWDSDSSAWKEMSQGGGGGNHTDLSDMPDDEGYNADHDERYYTKDQFDIQKDEIYSQLNNLKYLIPDNAAPLSYSLDLVNGSYKTGYLSHGYDSEQHFDTLSPEQSYSKIVKGSNFILQSESEETQFNNADKGILLLKLDDSIVDTFDLNGYFDETYRIDYQRYTPVFGSNGKIEITEVKAFNNFASFQKGVFRVHLTSSDLNPGENKIQLVHSFDGENNETEPLIIFYDPSEDLISLSDHSVSEGALVSAKSLSGIQYYTLGDQLRFTFLAENLYNNTYHYPEQVYVDATEFGVSEYYINHNSDGTVYFDFGEPTIDAIIKSEELKSLDVEDVASIEPLFKTKGRNLNGTSDYVESFQFNYLINTYSNSHSTDKTEDFVDEQYRLYSGDYDEVPYPITDVWVGEDALKFGELQVFNGSLVYPRIDFNFNYFPQQYGVDYTGFTDERYYYRAFVDPGIPHNSGIFFIENFNLADENTKINVKLPGQTGWLDLCESYNSASFTGSEGDGCLTSVDGEYFQWTSGTFSTANSGYMVIIRISMNNLSSSEIKTLNVDW